MSRSSCDEPPCQLPRIVIPAGAKWGGWDGWEFTIQSGQEIVEVSIGDTVCCHGSPEALVSAGIMHRDWIPSNDKRSRCVVFGSDGPTIRTGGRGRPKGDYMLAMIRGPAVFVRFPATPEQQATYKERSEQESQARRRENVCSHVTVAGIRHEQDRAGWWESWTGERSKLIEMEICREDQFPDDRKRLKDGEDWSMRRLPGGLYRYSVRASPGEAKPLRGAKYDSGESWRKYVSDTSGSFLTAVLINMNGTAERVKFGETTIRYDDETMERVLEAAGELMGAIESGRIIKTTKNAAPPAAVKLAKGDVDLQAFIAGITSSKPN